RLFELFFQAEDGIRDFHVTGVQTCALPIFRIYPGGLGLETEDQTMAQYVVDYRLDILGADEVPAGEPGVGPGAAIQGDGAPGAEIGRASCREGVCTEAVRVALAGT